MPIDESVAHLQLVVGAGIVLHEPGCEQLIPMPPGAAEQMCAELDACGEHALAARHRQELQVLQTVAQRIASAQGSPDPEAGP
jgi:hypothetical protein